MQVYSERPPAQWLVLDRMPLNGNGKVDRCWLKEQFRKNEGQTGLLTVQGPPELDWAGIQSDPEIQA